MYRIWILILLAITSCQANEEKIPETLIREELMVDLIVELEMNQAFIKLKKTEVDSINQEAMFQNTFSKYDTSQDKFNESLNYYTGQPELIADIYNQVIIKLSEREANTKIPEELEEEILE